MKQFHPLTVARVVPETEDSVRIALAVPREFATEYRFLPGQHLAFQVTANGKQHRRTYSIASGVDEALLEIGVRVQTGGQVSEFAAHELRVGDVVDAMPPAGQFHLPLDERHANTYVGIAAGSGITPILSMIKSVMGREPNSRFVLFYGNRELATTMFFNDLQTLQDRFAGRLQPYFLFSREDQPFAVARGRLDAASVPALLLRYGLATGIADYFVCGPDSMIGDVTQALYDTGVDRARVHSERFGPPARQAGAARPSVTADRAMITVIMDGRTASFEMHRQDSNIVEAAAKQGIDLPFSCKGGVCATCRCQLREGEVTMANQFALEGEDLRQGYVLACQSRPVSKTVILDFDAS